MTLLQNLENQTQELKVKYLAQVAEWARNEFGRIERLAAWYQSKGAYNENKDKYYAAQKFLHRIGYSALQAGVDKFIAKEVASGEQHYNSSLLKLVFRLNKKGVDDTTEVTITRGWVGVNLEIVIAHGDKITRAFTIRAEGAIQRPHYRYLVK